MSELIMGWLALNMVLTTFGVISINYHGKEIIEERNYENRIWKYIIYSIDWTFLFPYTLVFYTFEKMNREDEFA